METKNNVKCSICGKGYYLCKSCEKHKPTAWKLYTDTSEHYKVFQIVHGVSIGVYTKEEAKKRLVNVDLSDMNTFKPEVKAVLEDILNTNVKEDKVENKVVEDKKYVPTNNKNKGKNKFFKK